jgi:hypothetical protein
MEPFHFIAHKNKDIQSLECITLILNQKYENLKPLISFNFEILYIISYASENGVKDYSLGFVGGLN